MSSTPERPRLRPVEVLPVDAEGGAAYALRDPLEVSPHPVVLSAGALARAEIDHVAGRHVARLAVDLQGEARAGLPLTRRTMPARPAGVDCAFLWVSMRASCDAVVTAPTHSIARTPCVDNLMMEHSNATGV